MTKREFLERVKAGGVIVDAEGTDGYAPLPVAMVRTWLKLADGLSSDVYHVHTSMVTDCDHNKAILHDLTAGVSDSMAWGHAAADTFSIGEYGYPVRFLLRKFRDVPINELDRWGIALVLGNYRESATLIAEQQKKKLLHARVSLRTPDSVIPESFRDYSWWTYGVPM